jgi:hypothetical protein
LKEGCGRVNVLAGNVVTMNVIGLV